MVAFGTDDTLRMGTIPPSVSKDFQTLLYDTRRERGDPREFREEDRNEPVVAPEGVAVGRIGEIGRDRNRATVERTDDHEGPTEELKRLLGWDDDDGDGAREIRREHVDRYENGRVYLQPRP
jgi:hypothetical protein